jgi:hypothetical protein
MDRALLISYLQAAEDRVAVIEQQIANQRGVISSLRRGGHDTSSASAELNVMEQTHMQYVGDRDRLRDELAMLSAAQLGNRRRIRRTPDGRR